MPLITSTMSSGVIATDIRPSHQEGPFLIPSPAPVNAIIVNGNFINNIDLLYRSLSDISKRHSRSTLPGAANSKAYAVNALGQTAGSSDLTGSAQLHATIWDAQGNPVDVSASGSTDFSSAYAI